MNKKFLISWGLVSALLTFSLGTIAEDKVNHKVSYVLNGATVSPWTASLGDAANWYIPLQAGEAITKRKDLIASLLVGKDGKNAISLDWKGKRKNEVSAFSIGGEAIDLSTVEDKVALVFDFKLGTRVKYALAVAMGCGDPCKGKVQVRKNMKKYKKDTWYTMPIPLNCFSANGADLTKINAPFILESSGKLKIDIHNVRLMSLPDGELGCKAP